MLKLEDYSKWSGSAFCLLAGFLPGLLLDRKGGGTMVMNVGELFLDSRR
jgi:hypothetical protein